MTTFLKTFVLGGFGLLIFFIMVIALTNVGMTICDFLIETNLQGILDIITVFTISVIFGAFGGLCITSLLEKGDKS